MKPRAGWGPRLAKGLGWGGLALASWGLCLLVLQGLFGRQIETLQTVQLARELALNVRLTELALERYPPDLVSELTGLDLAVRPRPPAAPAPSLAMQRQAEALQQQSNDFLRNDVIQVTQKLEKTLP